MLTLINNSEISDEVVPAPIFKTILEALFVPSGEVAKFPVNKGNKPTPDLARPQPEPLKLLLNGIKFVLCGSNNILGHPPPV